MSASNKVSRKIIIDCDAGLDDANAIFMALCQDHVDVLAITCVVGNTSLTNVTTNVLRILKVCNRLDIPVYRGCAKTLLGAGSSSDGFHGSDGLGDIPDPLAPKDHLQQKHAVNAIIDLVEENPGEISLVALGPLTNIAMIIRLYPDFGTKLKDCYIMGGNVEGKGNISLTGEFNTYSDPESAYVVFHELHTLVNLFPLEICWNYSRSWEWFDRVSQMTTDTAKNWIRWYEQTSTRMKSSGSPDFRVYDQVAMAAATNPELIEEEQRLYGTVELSGTLTRGQMVWDWNNTSNNNPNINLVKKINADAFKNLMDKSFL